MSSIILGTRLTKGYQQLTSLSSATALTVPTDARIALIQAEDQSVRWRDDGIDPTTTVGMLMPSTVVLEYDGQLANLRFIEVTASAKLNVSYYG